VVTGGTDIVEIEGIEERVEVVVEMGADERDEEVEVVLDVDVEVVV
jgi:hypothetical protein